MKKALHQLTSEEAKEAIKNFYKESQPEELIKLAKKAGLFDERFKGKVNIDAIYKRINPFDKM